MTGEWVCIYSVVSDSEAPWTVNPRAPWSMEFSRQECWSRLPFPTPGDLPDPGIKPTFLCLLYWQADSSTTAPAKNLTNEWGSIKLYPRQTLQNFISDLGT